MKQLLLISNKNAHFSYERKDFAVKCTVLIIFTKVKTSYNKCHKTNTDNESWPAHRVTFACISFWLQVKESNKKKSFFHVDNSFLKFLTIFFSGAFSPVETRSMSCFVLIQHGDFYILCHVVNKRCNFSREKLKSSEKRANYLPFRKDLFVCRTNMMKKHSCILTCLNFKFASLFSCQKE